jgi:hypothetical protein
LLTRNLHDVFGENDPARRRTAIDEIFTEDCVFYDPSRGVYRGREEIDRLAGTIRATHPDFRYQPIAEPRNWAMAVGSSGYRAGLVRRQLTPGLTSLLPGTAGLPPLISFSISYPELDSAVRRPAASYVCFWQILLKKSEGCVVCAEKLNAVVYVGDCMEETSMKRARPQS